MALSRITLLLCCALLVACGDGKPAATGAAGEDLLPKPAAAGKSVTGMPNPGVASVRPAPAETAATDIVELPQDIEAVDPASIDEAGPDAPVEVPQPPSPEAPTPPQPVEPAVPANGAATITPAG